MRRLLVLALAVVMIFSLFACGKADENTTEPDGISTEPVAGPEETDAPVETDPTETDPTDYDTTPVYETEADDTDAEITTSADITTEPSALEFTEVNETVYVYGTAILNVRKEPSVNSEKLGEMKEGETVTRLGYNSSWSKISYYGKICYASSDYLTTSAPLEFTDKYDTVYTTAEGTLNIRKKPDTKAEIIAALPYGTELSRTGISTSTDANGITWSRILYNGQVCYASTAFLDTEKPSLADADKDFTALSETVYVVRQNGEIKVESINIRALPSRSSNSIAVVGPDTELTRTGIAKSADAEGIIWSRVVYDGKTGYIGSGYLTADAPVNENAAG